MLYEIKYRAVGNAKLLKKVYDCQRRCDAADRLYFEHAVGKLEGVKPEEYIKIECITPLAS